MPLPKFPVFISVLVVATSLTLSSRAVGQTPTPAAPPPTLNTNRVVGLFPSPDGGGTLYRCLFDRTFDLTGDLWPDGWTRKSGIEDGIGYPSYVPIEIVEADSPASSFALHIAVAGGASAAFSPQIPVRPGMEYTASALVRATGLTRNHVFLTLSFFARDGVTPLATYRSTPIQNAPRWVNLAIPPVVSEDRRATYAVLGLCVVPRTRQDYAGDVYFTNITLEENPHVTLTTESAVANPSHVFFSPRDINITCQIDGVPMDQKRATLTLEDHYGRTLASRDVEMEVTPVTERTPESDTVVIRNITGKGTWQSVPLMAPGFYAFRARLDYQPLHGEARTLLTDSQPLRIAVLDAATSPVGSEFGWTLAGKSPPEIASMRTLLGQAGVGRIKIPVWLASTAPASDLEQLRDTADWLARRQVELVGLWDPPPPEVTSSIALDATSASVVFTQPSPTWFPTMQPTLLHLALLVKHWQLGGDLDRSLADIPNLEAMLNDARQLFNTIGHDVSLGFAWDWSLPLPPTFRSAPLDPMLQPLASTPTTTPLTAFRVTPQEMARDEARRSAAREFVQLSSSPSLTPAELALGLQGGRDSGLLRWVSIEPLPITDYSIIDRVNDLVDSMVMAKIHRADAAFCPTPFDDVRGLMQRDGTPGVLFLPWRTIALQLDRGRFIGSVRLPQRSRNQIFEKPDGSCVMLVSNSNATVETPIQEVLFLGESVEEIELWGLRRVPPQDRGSQVITVAPVPTLVTGLHPDVVRWRQTFTFAKTEIPSFIGQRNNNSFRFVNPTQEAVSVRVELVMDGTSGLKLSPAAHQFMLQPGEEVQRDFVVTIAPTTASGSHPIRADVQVEGLKTLRFAVYDDFQVGGNDLAMSFLTRLNRRGELEVLQNFTNEGENTVSYRFILYVPGRPMERTRVLAQGPGRNDQMYTLPRGEELLGKELVVRGEPIPPSLGQPLLYKFKAVAY